MIKDSKGIRIDKYSVGNENPCFIIAEISANHQGCLDTAERIVRAAKDAGADAIKLQTYTPETITFDLKNDEFLIKEGLWKGRYLADLYKEAQTPWEWHKPLKTLAQELGLIFLSSPFDKTAVDFLDELNVPVFKIASFENADIDLIGHATDKGKPIIISSGTATLEELDRTFSYLAARNHKDVILLKCVSNYPARPDEMNLRHISFFKKRYGVEVGLSDHTLDIDLASLAVAQGACMVEKHLTIKRSDGGPDADFSLEPGEFKEMVQKIRKVEKVLGKESHAISDSEVKNRRFRRSLFVNTPIKKGEVFTDKNVKSARPSAGLPAYMIQDVIGKKSLKDLGFGKPITEDCIEP